MSTKVEILTAPMEKMASLIESHVKTGWTLVGPLGTFVDRKVKHCHGPASAGGVDVTDYDVVAYQMVTREVPE